MKFYFKNIKVAIEFVIGFVKKYMFLIPPVQLIATFIFSFIDMSNIDLLIYVGNNIGYSLFTSLVYIGAFFNRKYCIFTKVSAIGLFFMALLNSLGSLVNYELYSDMYDQGIFIICLILTYIFSQWIFLKTLFRTY